MGQVKGGDQGPSEFGKLVKRYREARSLSQERLGTMAGLEGSYISQIETGSRGRRPGRDVVIALAQALRAPAAELLRAAGRLEPGDELSPDERPSFEAFVGSDPLLRQDQKEVLIATYRTYVHRTAEP